MKPAAEFGEIKGRFERINDILAMCKMRAQKARNADSLALVGAVQALTRELRDMERNLLEVRLAERRVDT